MLPREVRCCFFQERVFHFEFTVPPLQLSYPFLVGHVRRKRISSMLFSVTLHPEPERGIVNTKLPRHLGDWQRVIDYLPGGLLLEFRSVSFRFSRHWFPSFPGESYWIPCPGTVGHLRSSTPPRAT